ncbi:9559_t:CDS:2 [Gigaspora rosea]|nr:9559_t:CDS:2 [Gigaspora rosea]
MEKTNPFLLIIPLEIFVQICNDLSPDDLLSLSSTCRTLNKDLCCESKYIQKIWCNARHNYIPCRKLPPPRGMSENAYTKLLTVDKCFYCCRKGYLSKIFWPRGVRCCGPCLKVHAVNQNELKEIYFRPNIIIELIPFASAFNHQENKYYFLDLIRPLEEELTHIPLEDYEIWHETNKVKVDVGYLTKEIRQRIKEDGDYTSTIKADRRKAIEEKLDGMCQEVDENGNVKFNCEVLNRCDSLKNSINLARPFNENCWKRLRHNLEVNYDLLLNEKD